MSFTTTTTPTSRTLLLLASLTLCALTAVATGCGWQRKQASQPTTRPSAGRPGAGAGGVPSTAPATDPAVRAQALQQYVNGVKAQRAGDRERAIEAFNTATQTNPGLIMARSRLGDIYREDKQYRQAAEQYEVLIRLDPRTSDNHYRLGVAYHLIPELQRAVAAYLRALDLQPKDFKSHMNLGLVYTVLGQKDDAVRHAREAVRLNPKSAVAHANLGAVLDGAGRYAEAAAAYRRAIEMDPSRLATYLNLTSNLLAQKRPAEAVSVMDALIRRRDTAPYRRRYGDVLAAAGRLEEAAEQYTQALKQDPKYFTALNALGDVQIARYRKSLQLDDNFRTDAVTYWRRSLEMRPDQPQVQAKVKRWAQ